MSDLFPQLARALRPGETLNFRFAVLDGDRIEVVVQPAMPDAPTLPDDAARIRAALAMPLRLTGTPDEISRLFSERLQSYREARSEAADGFSTLMQTLKQATGEATTAATKASQATGSNAESAATATPAAATEPADPTPAPTTNPDSLF